MRRPPRPIPPDPLLDIPGVADLLNTSIRHIRRLVAEQRIPVVRVGRLIRFDPTDIAEWLDTNRRGVHSA